MLLSFGRDFPEGEEKKNIICQSLFIGMEQEYLCVTCWVILMVRIPVWLFLCECELWFVSEMFWLPVRGGGGSHPVSDGIGSSPPKTKMTNESLNTTVS